MDALPDGDRRGRLRLAVPALVLVLAIGVVVVGVVLARGTVYNLGIVLSLIAAIVLWTRLLRPQNRGRRSRLLVGAVVLVLLAGGAAVTPRVYLARMDGPVSWEATAERFTESIVLRDGVLVYDKHIVRKVDPGDGSAVFRVPTDGDHIVVGGDGSFVQQGVAHTSYHAADGRRLWRVDHNRVQKVGASGHELWRAVARAQDVGYRTAVESRSHLDSEYEPIKIAPAVVALTDVQGHPRASLVIMSVKGEVIDDLEATPVGYVGDLVVVRVARCQYAGLRKGKEVWRTADLPCTYHVSPPPRLLRHRMYLGKHHDKSSASAYTVSLESGAWRAIRSVSLSAKVPPEDVPGDDVLVERRRGRLTGVDAATGEKLWTHDVPDGDPTGIRVQNGAVFFRTPANGRLLELADPDLRLRTVLTVLDARTGRPTARYLVPKDDRLTFGCGIGPGRAYVTLESGKAMVLGSP